jgi:hypothetical protein
MCKPSSVDFRSVRERYTSSSLGVGMRYRVAYLIVFFAFGFIPTPAAAYIDPNTGGMLFQILAPLTAFVVSVWLMAKEKCSAIVRRVVHFFLRRK